LERHIARDCGRHREKIARHGFYVIFISSGVAMALDLNSGLNLHQPAAGEKPTA
jgi:hypothetical protein